MVLILNGIAALLIRIKGIKFLGQQTWVDDFMAARGACSILSILFPMAASLYYLYTTYMSSQCDPVRN